MIESKSPLVICGGQLKNRCGIVCDYTNSSICDIAELDLSEEVSFYVKEDNGVVFCNPLFLNHVIEQVDLSDKLLITHNTDASLVSYQDGKAVFRYLSGQEWEVSNLYPKNWLAQNSLVRDVSPLPLGVTDNDIMEFDASHITKSKMLYKNFGIQNNPPERQLCDYHVQIPNEYVAGSNRQEYYKSLAQSYFAVSPDGFGVDCHRHWEALYFNCIPIVTRNTMTEFYSTLFPIIVIDTWEDFNIQHYTEELYAKLISEFDRSLLDIDVYINKLTIK
jgi:hypothetical protein